MKKYRIKHSFCKKIAKITNKRRNEVLSLDEIEILCLSIEGELATSTPKFIQEQIDHIKNTKASKSIRGISLIKRLENIKASLSEEK